MRGWWGVGAVVVAGGALSPRRRVALLSLVGRWRSGPARRGVRYAMAEVSHGVARRLHVGQTLRQAVEGAARDTPLHDEVARVVREHERGMGLARAVRRWAERSGSSEVAMFAVVVELSSELGARPELFDRLAVSLRRRDELREDARAQASQARMSAWIVATLPWAVALAVVAGGGEPARVLLHEPVGWLCAGGALLLEGLGVWWMQLQLSNAVDR